MYSCACQCKEIGSFKIGKYVVKNIRCFWMLSKLKTGNKLLLTKFC